MRKFRIIAPHQTTKPDGTVVKYKVGQIVSVPDGNAGVWAGYPFAERADKKSKKKQVASYDEPRPEKAVVEAEEEATSPPQRRKKATRKKKKRAKK